MEPIMDAWKSAWQGYGISNYALLVASLVAAVSAYRNWQKTLLVVWILVYVWTMTILLGGGGAGFDMQEGMNALWVCCYGLFGFLFLAFLIYTNLKA